MIRIAGEEKTSIFYVFSADWESMIKSKTASLAVSKSLTLGFDKFGKDFTLSPWIKSINLTHLRETEELEENTEHFYTPEMLADIGKHNLSKKYSNLLEKVQNNDKKN